MTRTLLLPLSLLPLLALLGTACGDKDGGNDSGAPPGDAGADTGTDDGGDSGAAGQTTAVLGTVSSDYATAALATVSLDDWTVTDEITDLPADSGVVATGGRIVVLGRYGYDSVRIYEPGRWDEPTVEFALADGANPHDVEECGGQLFVTQYGLDRIAVHDPDSGLVVGSVDLSPWADADGVPEASTLARSGERLYVGLQNLDQAGGWETVGGHVVEVDCATREVTGSWATGGETNVHPWPGGDGDVLVAVVGGGVHLLDTASGTLGERVVDTAALGVDLVGLAAHGAAAVAVLVDPDYAYSIACIDLATFDLTVAEDAGHYLAGIRGNDRGEAWIAGRQHWTAEPGDVGQIVYDIPSCTSLTGGELVQTTLGPSSVAFY